MAKVFVRPRMCLIQICTIVLYFLFDPLLKTRTVKYMSNALFLDQLILFR